VEFETGIGNNGQCQPKFISNTMNGDKIEFNINDPATGQPMNVNAIILGGMAYAVTLDKNGNLLQTYHFDKSPEQVVMRDSKNGLTETANFKYY